MEVGTTFAGGPVRGRAFTGSGTLQARALTLWPRLDRRKLTRCGGDPRRIATLIAQRTTLPHAAILAMLLGTSVEEAEIETWFG